MSTRKETASPVLLNTPATCYHCGDMCRDEIIQSNGRNFCCEGCKLVFEILDENNLCNYYTLNPAPGKSDNKKNSHARYDFLDDEKIRQQLISFTDGIHTDVTFLIPQIHCSSCIWLLEHLYKLDAGIKRSTVNFLKREAHIVFNEEETSLRKITELLNKIGYPPHISLDNLKSRKPSSTHKSTYYKLGVAFFCFGNIMLLSFPEYFGLSGIFEKDFRNLFGYLNILLSLPVLLYADTGFFKSAIAGLRQGRLNMDFPISLGIVVMYARSLFEIISGSGAGYMDTFAALIFFMLAGRLFQNKSYERLSFDRDYKSYFPIAITTVSGGELSSKAVSEIRRGDRILIRNEELIPCDSVLIKGEANIDYSFVTGENIPVSKKSGDRIYAGGKQLGSAIELEVINEVSKSRLTQLWNESNYKKAPTGDVTSITDTVSKYFTIAVILLATGAGIWYLNHGLPARALNAFTAILIITCPCALALSYPFTLGNSIRHLGKGGLYLKNAGVVEQMSGVNAIVFDKTGTLTQAGEANISYFGPGLSEHEKSVIRSLTSHSTHPLSRLLARRFEKYPRLPVTGFHETPGQGIEGTVDGMLVRAGSASFTQASPGDDRQAPHSTRVQVTINGENKGLFAFSSLYRDGLNDTIHKLSDGYELHMLSGDNHSERNNLERYFPKSNSMHFNQSPGDKLNFIKSLQQNGKKVMMFGDGLNDSGALIQSDTGIAVTDNVNNFSPASDGILDAASFHRIPRFLSFSKYSMKIIYASYFISLLYNCVGIYFAIRGDLSPVIAAIIMPLSTVTIILFTTATSSAIAKHMKVNN